MGEQDHDDHVDDRGESERVREALHAADREDEQHDRRKQVRGLRREHRAEGSLPAGLDGADELTTVSELVADAFEVDDERVGGEADRDDQARDAGE